MLPEIDSYTDLLLAVVQITFASLGAIVVGIVCVVAAGIAALFVLSFFFHYVRKLDRWLGRQEWLQ